MFAGDEPDRDFDIDDTPERPPVLVYLHPALIPEGTLRGGIAVVVDILRASTVIVEALAAGCNEVVPCVELGEARAEAARREGDRVLLGGERQGLPIAGFDLGNSPSTYTRDRCRGRTLVLTTTNGTRALHASLPADRVFVAGFVNLSATAESLAIAARPVHIVCAGTNGFVSWEDSLFAGALAHRLSMYCGTDDGVTPLFNFDDDAAQVVTVLWSDYAEQVDRLADLLASGRGGRRVTALGLEDDIAAAADIDRHDFVAEIRRDPLRIIAN